MIDIKQIGNYETKNSWDNPQTGRVYSTSGLSPTINTCGGGGHEVKILENEVFGVYTGVSNDFQRGPLKGISRCLKAQTHDAGVIYTESQIIELGNINSSQDGIVVSPEGISKTLTAGHGNQPKILESMILTPKRTEYGKTIRKAYESGGIKESRHNMTELKPRTDGISNTLTTVQKDNMVLEPTVKIKQATKEGFIECKLGGVADLSFPGSRTRRGRVQDKGDICPTLMVTENAIYRIESLYRIRKLTPRECWRLMDFSDLDFFSAMLQSREKALELMEKYKDDLNGITIMREAETMQKTSNTQLYKEAGNSIVKAVLKGIFKQVIDIECYKQAAEA